MTRDLQTESASRLNASGNEGYLVCVCDALFNIKLKTPNHLLFVTTEEQ